MKNDLSIIRCVNVNDALVKHYWTYFPFMNTSMKITFDLIQHLAKILVVTVSSSVYPQCIYNRKQDMKIIC